MNENRYLDSWKSPETTRIDRAESAMRHLQKLLPAAQFESQPKDILEIGSGIGGVTVALQEYYPTSSITAVDRDERVADIAEELHVPFLLTDLLTLDDESAKELLQHRDSIVALRTSGEVALKMLDQLSRCGFKGLFTFSLIEETDRNYFDRLDKSASAHAQAFHFESFFHKNYIILENARQFTERGYVVRFDTKEKRT